jgi:flavin reductase (DIM6/NTAB) family NADH-FMN oxidoreductase RutF/AraC-like DNA-binding protein
VSYLTYGTPVGIDPEPLRTFYLVQVPLSGAARVRIGRREFASTPRVASVVNPTDTLRMEWSGDCGQLIVRFESTFVESLLASYLGHTLRHGLRFQGELDCDSHGSRRWLEFVRHVVTQIESDPAAAPGPLASRQLEQAMLALLLDAQPSDFSEQLARDRSGCTPRHVRRAVEFIEAHVAEPIGIDEIVAASGASMRSLYEGFRRHRGTSPMEFLRFLRLRRVRDELSSAQSAKTVSDVATRWGFYQFGRFAAQYRQLFGETPSATLRRTLSSRDCAGRCSSRTVAAGQALLRGACELDSSRVLEPPSCRRIAIIGAGQSGLQLGIGLLRAGHRVSLLSNRPADAIRSGRVLSSQCMFDSALQTERDLALAFWAARCPEVAGLEFTVADGQGRRRAHWLARFERCAQSVDQRLKIPGWMHEFEQLGGELVLREAGIEELERCARAHDLVIVASGKGEIGALFELDRARSPFTEPQRALSLAYVRGTQPQQPCPAVAFSLIPGVGEYFVFPALTTTGPCEIMVFEGVIGGPMDCWSDTDAPERHLEKCKELLARFVPWEAGRCRDAVLTDGNGVLTGRLVPHVRQPVATQPSGAQVLGMGDALVLNDPVTGQGANNAARCAEVYLESILSCRESRFDARWMRQTFERYWRGYAQWVVQWTNSFLTRPAPHMMRLLRSAAELPALADTIANGFDDPRTFYPWWFDAGEAERFLGIKEQQAAQDRFDRRDFRNALGQFATGVTVVTTRTPDGRRVGMTANSFSSLSLDPPLVLWSVAHDAPSVADFTDAQHFAINVLAADQHHLSRQFSTPQPDKFNGVGCREGIAGVPVIDGAIASFECRNLRQYDGGDHIIVVGEVARYERTGGEPLVFHSGSYRITTRHPHASS